MQATFVNGSILSWIKIYSFVHKVIGTLIHLPHSWVSHSLWSRWIPLPLFVRVFPTWYFPGNFSASDCQCRRSQRAWPNYTHCEQCRQQPLPSTSRLAQLSPKANWRVRFWTPILLSVEASFSGAKWSLERSISEHSSFGLELKGSLFLSALTAQVILWTFVTLL